MCDTQRSFTYQPINNNFTTQTNCHRPTRVLSQFVSYFIHKKLCIILFHCTCFDCFKIRKMEKLELERDTLLRLRENADRMIGFRNGDTNSLKANELASLNNRIQDLETKLQQETLSKMSIEQNLNIEIESLKKVEFFVAIANDFEANAYLFLPLTICLN